MIMFPMHGLKIMENVYVRLVSDHMTPKFHNTHFQHARVSLLLQLDALLTKEKYRLKTVWLTSSKKNSTMQKN